MYPLVILLLIRLRYVKIKYLNFNTFKVSRECSIRQMGKSRSIEGSLSHIFTTTVIIKVLNIGFAWLKKKNIQIYVVKGVYHQVFRTEKL